MAQPSHICIIIIINPSIFRLLTDFDSESLVKYIVLFENEYISWHGIDITLATELLLTSFRTVLYILENFK